GGRPPRGTPGGGRARRRGRATGRGRGGVPAAGGGVRRAGAGGDAPAEPPVRAGEPPLPDRAVRRGGPGVRTVPGGLPDGPGRGLRAAAAGAGVRARARPGGGCAAAAGTRRGRPGGRRAAGARRGRTRGTGRGRGGGGSLMRTRIKICGVRDAETARAAAEAGADAVGFVFVPSSPRYIAPDDAVGLMYALPPLVTAVGVVADLSVDEFSDVEEACPTQLAQLHGDEGLKTVQQCGPGEIKAVRAGPKLEADLRKWANVDEVDAVLIDGPKA